MIILKRFILSIFLFPILAQSQDIKVIAVLKDTSYRLIDLEGNYISEISYEEVGEFVNGYAKVRQNGSFGFINHLGETAVPCDYLHVENFMDERAVVYNQPGWPMLIDTKGNLIINKLYSFIDYRAPNRYSVGTSDTLLLLNRYGQQVENQPDKSAYIRGFVGKYEIHSKLILPLPRKIKNFKDLKRDYYLMDSFGNFIKNSNHFNSIKSLGNNLLLFETDSINYIKSGELKLIFSYNKDSIILLDDFKDGPARLRGQDGNIKYLHPSGEILFIEPGYNIHLPFYKNATFLEKNGFHYFLSSTLKFDSSKKFSSLGRDTFTNGFCKVRFNELYGIIDTKGNWSVEPHFKHIMYYNIHLNYVIGTKKGDETRGIYTVDGELKHQFIENSSISPTFKVQTSPARFLCYSDSQNFIIKPNGQVIWSGNKDKTKPLRFKVIKEQYLKNFFFPEYPANDSSFIFNISASDTFGKDSLHLLVRESSQFYKDKFFAHEVLLINNTIDTLDIRTMGGEFLIYTEALNKNGNWVRIKTLRYYPSCGNSYYHIGFPPFMYYKYIQPKYYGHYKTKVRYIYYDGKKDIISNVVPASINLQQFWDEDWKDLYYDH